MFVIEGRSQTLDVAQVVRTHGAVLMRGLATKPCEFLNIAEKLGPVRHDISCSAGPRVQRARGVFTSNDAPSHKTIPCHHEMAQCLHPPKYVLFYCDVEPMEGGCTPFVQSSVVLNEFERCFPAITKRLRTEGLRYRRVYPETTDDSSPVGKSWKERYGVTTKEDAMRACAEENTTCTWLPGNALCTTGPVVFPFVDEGDGPPAFFIAAETSFGGDNTGPIKEVVHPDGRPLTSDVARAFEYIADFASRESRRFKWKHGDVLILDNRRMMHSRDTFTKPRSILVSLVGDITNPSFRCLEKR